MQLQAPIPVTPLIVIPRDQLHKGLTKPYPGLSIKDTRPVQKKYILNEPFNWQTNKSKHSRTNSNL